MSKSTELSKNQYVRRSYIGYKNAIEITSLCNGTINDDFMVAINMAGDAIELLLKGLAYYFSNQYEAQHDYQSILTGDINSKLKPEYKTKFIQTTDLSNRPFLEGRLLHEAKYADETTILSKKKIEQGMNEDFYKNLKFNDLLETLLYYENLRNLFIDIIQIDTGNSIDKKIFDTYDICRKNVEDLNLLKQEEVLTYYSKISQLVNLWINYFYEESSKSYLLFLDDNDDFLYSKELIFFSNLDTSFDVDSYMQVCDVQGDIKKYSRFVNEFHEYCKNKYIYMN